MKHSPSCLALGLVLAFHGCTAPGLPKLPGTAPHYTQEDLRAELADFASQFDFIVSGSADAISERTSDRQIRKRTLRWKIQLIPLVHEASVESNPQEAYVSILTIMVMMRQYFTEGAGRDAFGDQQELAVQTAVDLEDEILEVGSKFLRPDDVKQMHKDADAFASQRLIRGQDFAIQGVRRALAEVEATSMFKRVASVPLSPFRALEGVGESSAAIRAFNATARDFVRTLERLPEQTRWQIELLLYDVEDKDATVALLASMESLAHSADQISETTASLPAEARALLADSEPTLVRLQELLEQAQGLAAPLQEVTHSWERILSDDGEAPSEPGRPFDIREWQATALEIGATAERLQSLTNELRTLGESPALGAAVGELMKGVDRADTSARAWIDHAAWRGLQLLLLGFGLLVLYRVASARLRRG